jgi:hypothetical protein
MQLFVLSARILFLFHEAAEHRKTCEELALLGYTKPDVYLIDIDGNGRFPPAHVKCEFQSPEDSTKTIVEHNLPSQVVCIDFMFFYMLTEWYNVCIANT